MSTFMANASTVDPKWLVIDARDQVVGRLAVVISTILRGKHRPEYTPHCDTGDFIIVVNVGGRLAGIVVDTVSDVISVDPGQRRALPEFEGHANRRFIEGLAQIESPDLDAKSGAQLEGIPAHAFSKRYLIRTPGFAHRRFPVVRHHSLRPPPHPLFKARANRHAVESKPVEPPRVARKNLLTLVRRNAGALALDDLA